MSSQTIESAVSYWVQASVVLILDAVGRGEDAGGNSLQNLRNSLSHESEVLYVTTRVSLLCLAEKRSTQEW